MKKIILAVAIICVAAISHAAAVGWTCMGANAYADGSYSVFVIGLNGVDSVSQIKAIIAADGLAGASAYAFASDTISAAGAATKAAASSGKSITYSGSGTDTYNAFLFVQDKDGKNASYTSTVSISMNNDSTGKAFAFANQSTNFSNNNFTVNTPEPTSGVLLLLGMAGLALKRKRA